MSKVPGRLHATGGVLFILCGIAHSIGQFTSTPLDDAGRAFERTLRLTAIPGTPFTYWNVLQCWGVLYGAMSILFGVLLLVAGARRGVALVGVLAALAQTACVLVYATPPPAFFMIPAALLLLGSWFWRARPAA